MQENSHGGRTLRKHWDKYKQFNRNMMNTFRPSKNIIPTAAATTTAAATATNPQGSTAANATATATAARAPPPKRQRRTRGASASAATLSRSGATQAPRSLDAQMDHVNSV